MRAFSFILDHMNHLKDTTPVRSVGPVKECTLPIYHESHGLRLYELQVFQEHLFGILITKEE